MPQVPPLISVIIPHLNQAAELDACLRSLSEQTLSRDHFEVIVVDNGSNSMPHGVVSKYRSICLLQETEPGPGLARNRGVLASQGALLCFVDADCRAHPQWLSVALDQSDKCGAGTILGGDVQIWRDDTEKFSAIEAYESVFAYMQKRYIEEHGFSGTGNLVVKRADFDQIGAFVGIEAAEDMEWGAKALSKGFVFKYVDSLIVYHPARKSLRELLLKWDRHLTHYANKARERRYWRFAWGLRAIGVLGSPFLSAMRVIANNRVRGAGAKVKAIGVLFVVRVYRAWKMIRLMVSPGKISWNR